MGLLLSHHGYLPAFGSISLNMSPLSNPLDFVWALAGVRESDGHEAWSALRRLLR